MPGLRETHEESDPLGREDIVLEVSELGVYQPEMRVLTEEVDRKDNMSDESEIDRITTLIAKLEKERKYLGQSHPWAKKITIYLRVLKKERQQHWRNIDRAEREKNKKKK